MRQRLAIAAALLAPRDLLVLDEPTNGLDPQGTREVRSLIGSLAADGTTVLVSSHLLAEVEQICTHLGVMREGRLVAQGTVAEVRGAGPAVVRVQTRQPEAAARVLRRARRRAGDAWVPVRCTAYPVTWRPRRSSRPCVHAGVGHPGFAVASEPVSRTCSSP